MANGMHPIQRWTERERAAGRPAASSSEVLAAVPDMMFRMDGDGRYLEFKPAKDMEPFVPPETLLGRRMHDVLPEGVADSGLAAVKAAIATDEAQTIVYELPMSDGPHRYEARVVPLDANEVLIIVRDLTENPLNTSPESASKYSLSQRELSVLASVALGLTDKQIAYKLGISPDTVRKHVASVRKKMGARSRTEASVRAVREGILS
ncbi:MAG: PAS domain-containing protein [Chloroflexi bacterium]|nr:PAS domain-containing protein [Chloroflexota bacterium]